MNLLAGLNSRIAEQNVLFDKFIVYKYICATIKQNN